MKQILTSIIILSFAITSTKMKAQSYIMPEETAEHEGTWLQWPHNYLYGPYYRDDVEPTWIAMTNALQSGEKVHIIAYDEIEKTHIISVLTDSSIPLDNIDFFIHETDDVWIRDNGPVFVYDQNNDLTILDWGFNGWGGDTPYSKCDVIPQSVSDDLNLPRIDLSVMVLEGGAIEHDGKGTMMATRSSITHASRNPNLSETQIENYLTTNMGITKFIWLDGVYGQEITDMHIDGVMKFANENTIVTMNNTDLLYWGLLQTDIDILYAATDINNEAYNFIYIPLTQNNVSTTYGTNLSYKGSYANYYSANTVVLVPTYNDVNDAVAISIIEGIYPNKTVLGIDVRNIYEYGGMIHCITQQQPVNLNTVGISDPTLETIQLSQNSPNPFNEFTKIKFSLVKDSTVSIEVYNESGQKIKSLLNESLSAGEQSITIRATDFQKGVYFYSLKVDGKVATSKKMIIID